MEESNTGMDPAVRRYFRKIINSFVAGLLWLISMSMLGIYFELAVIDGGLRWYNVLFYLLFLASLLWLIRFFYRSWNAPSGIMSDKQN